MLVHCVFAFMSVFLYIRVLLSLPHEVKRLSGIMAFPGHLHFSCQWASKILVRSANELNNTPRKRCLVILKSSAYLSLSCSLWQMKFFYPVARGRYW